LCLNFNRAEPDFSKQFTARPQKKEAGGFFYSLFFGFIIS
jgi:hypothetical protein